MDQKDASYYYIIDETANQTQNRYLKKTLQFLVPISITCFLVSYFSVFSLIFHQLHFYSSIYPFLDRKCMFLVFNGILAFLKLSTSALNYGGFLKSTDDEDGAEQVPNLKEIPISQEDAASVDYVDRTPLDAAIPEEKVIQQHEHEHDIVCQDVENDMVRLDIQELEADNDGDEEVEERGGVGDTPFVDDMRVSTEDMNKKFDEFIRRVKEEIRSTI